MFQIKANKKRNFMLIVIQGFLSENEVKDVVSRIMNAADTLTSGFTIINDISQFSPASQMVADEIGKAQSYVMKKGVGKTVRIVGNVLSRNQLKKTQQKVGASYEVIEVESLEDALTHI